MNRTVIAVAVCIFAANCAFVANVAHAQAQTQTQDDLTRRVDVTRDYAPRVDRAAKLSVRPQVADTTTLRPDLDYTIRPRVWASRFDVTPIRAAQLSAGARNELNPFYLKAGGGVPGQSVVDLYLTSTRPGATAGGVYVNHRGRFHDIDNYDCVRNSANATWNSFGAFGRADVGRRLMIAGDAGWDYDVLSYYGVRFAESDEARAVPMQHYSVPRASVVFGHDFADLSRLNFRIGADGYLLSDRYDRTERGGEAFAELGRRFGEHNLGLRADVNSWAGGKDENETGSSVYSLGGHYSYEGQHFLFRMGAAFASENYPAGEQEAKMRFLPQLELRFRLAGGAFNPYTRFDSRLTPNNMRIITQRNPYILLDGSPVGFAESEVLYGGRAGVNGGVAGVFSYNIYGGRNSVRNAAGFDYAADGGFDVRFFDKVEYSLFGAEMEVRAGRMLSVALDGQYNIYRDEDILYNYALPDWEVGIEARLRSRGERLSVAAGVRLRDGIAFTPDTERNDPTADLRLTVDYRISNRFGVFVEGRNLLNQSLYPLPFYRGTGASITAGVKLTL
ncbi:MAG: hypothetical protein FWE10_03980 [Rikenellaceae bacterium]|nr:hypothetical protein [Rikenellaceae bacterium]MCL2692886.1 hypothetical protein [Rikenellaceae bacterium]